MNEKTLAGGIRTMQPFLPARDFALSKRFYADLGFTVEPLSDKLAQVRLGPHSFLLQDFYVEQWASNFMIHVSVDNLAAWWAHIASLDLAGRYGVAPPRPPKRESWGSDVAYVFDPSGVLWHFSQPAAPRQ
ncbi:MAG: VOC family protein [Pseudolabrys sp.]